MTKPLKKLQFKSCSFLTLLQNFLIHNFFAMLYIKAKYNSRCFETDLQIKKGETVLYCPNLKMIFHYNSPSAKAFDAEQEEFFNRSQSKALEQYLAY